MWRLGIGLIFCITSAWADDDALVRLGGDFGLGAALVSVDGIDRTEAPTAFGVHVDYSKFSYLTLGVEHFRTLINDNGLSTAVGFSGLFFKFYPFSTRSQVLPTETWITSDEIIHQAYSVYIGGAVGVGQSSLRALTEQQKDRTISVGVYLGGRIGIEIPIRARLGAFTEFALSQTLVGTGTILFPRLSFGFFYYL